jgi:hypothetical protein
MRFLMFFSVLIASAVTNVGVSQASEGPWCLRTHKNMDNCSLPSLEMCRFQALPENGSCWANPNYRGVTPSDPRRSTRRARPNSY